MKRRLTAAFAAIWFAWAPQAIHAVVIQQDLDAKITSATGPFFSSVGETVDVRIFYDTDLVEQTPNTPSADFFSSFSPPSNRVFTMGVEIQVGDDVYSTVAPGTADHDIDVLDTTQLDEWSIDTVNVLTPINQSSITLRGDTNYVLPGDEGLTGTPIFPPEYCAVGVPQPPHETFALGNFAVYVGGQLVGSLIFDFLQGPTCSPPVVLCGDANADGMVSATDALVALRAGIGVDMCIPCRCDVDQSGVISATDALAVLQASVGQPITLTCPAC